MQLPREQAMTKVTYIRQFRSRRSPMAPTLRDSGALFWKEASADATPDALRGLPQEEMAAVLIKGMFAIYHLSREHAKLPKKVPDYLYDYALQFEEPIVPTAEILYAQYFHGGPFHADNDIPDDLYELGIGTGRNASSCVHHALRMHQVLAAFVDDAPRLIAGLFRSTTRCRSGRLLLPLFEACRQWSIDRSETAYSNVSTIGQPGLAREEASATTTERV